ncbi:5-hydroxytryptamine receptor 2 [Biomphalaria glabrata]|nr:5-hydroxytryptamine receptor 2 [Biomphalaria glabrata]
MELGNDIITDEQLDLGLLVCSKLLSPLFQLFAIFANILNLATFYTIGSKDGVNVTFLALSLSDLAYVLLDALNTVCLLIATSPWQPSLPVSMYSITGCVIPYQYIFLETSTSLETYLAVTRCCCVALPLKFKNVFTFRRSLSVLVIIFICNVAFRIPLLTTFGLTWKTSSATNLTRLTFYSTDSYVIFSRLEQLVGKTCFPVLFLLIAAVCSVILSTSLLTMSVKRKSMTMPVTSYDKVALQNLNTKMAMDMASSNSSRTMKSKEVQLVKAVTLVTMLQGVLLLILSIYSLVEAAIPEFFPTRKYRNSHNLILVVIYLLITMHAGGKTFVYYKFNSKFRESVKKTFNECLVLNKSS